MSIRSIQLLFFLGPPILLTVIRLVRLRSLGRARHYLLFGGVGAVHGLFLYGSFVLSEWRSGIDWTVSLVALMALSAAMIAGILASGYLLVALVIDFLPVGRSND